MDSSRFHILCQDEFLGFEQNDENGENFLEKREKEKTGIKNLKVGYNKVFGYYIEVTKSY